MGKIVKSPYPDISKILSAKKSRRQALSSLSWEEKVSIIVKMQKLLPKGKWKDADSAAKIEGHKDGGAGQPSGGAHQAFSAALHKPVRSPCR